ncbi:MAG: PEP-CTERM sorting domain-containing protein [Candidatus Obscuribacterales bacterium]|nr:PEP-CTERM sorting domain-containing protein [Candidatus Obscuribacterales bacterium]
MNSRLAIILSSLMLFATFNARATTYSVNIFDNSNPVTPIGVTGNIVTDGSLGVLTASDILSFDFVLTNGSFTRTSIGSTSGVVVSGSAFTATSSGLAFDFSANPVEFVKFENSVGDFFCLQSAGYACLPSTLEPPNEILFTAYAGPFQGSAAGFPQATAGNVQFASATSASVPEPSTVAIMLLGLGALGFLSSRTNRTGGSRSTKRSDLQLS